MDTFFDPMAGGFRFVPDLTVSATAGTAAGASISGDTASGYTLVLTIPAGAKGDKGDKGDTGTAANCTVKVSATTTAVITFTAATAIYKFAPTAASTVTFTAPTLAAGEVYEAELWITQGEVPVTLTLPTITWAGGTAQDMSKPGLYMLGLTYDGTDWFARTLQVRDDSYQGSYEDGDPGVYVYVDGNLIRSAQNAADWELDITGSTVYIIGSTTTFSGSTIGSGIYVETNKYQGGGYIGGGTISDVVLDGGTILSIGTEFNNCTFTSGELTLDGGTLNNCFLGEDIYSNYPVNAVFNGGTVKCAPWFYECTMNGVTIDVQNGAYVESVTANDCLFLNGMITFSIDSGTVRGGEFFDCLVSGDVVWVSGNIVNTTTVSGITIADIFCDGGTLTDCYVTGTADASMAAEISGGTVASGAHIKYGQDCTYVEGLTVLAGGTVTVYTDWGSTVVSGPTVVSEDTIINNNPNPSE